jgi:hypothetical protein
MLDETCLQWYFRAGMERLLTITRDDSVSVSEQINAATQLCHASTQALRLGMEMDERCDELDERSEERSDDRSEWRELDDEDQGQD